MRIVTSLLLFIACAVAQNATAAQASAEAAAKALTILASMPACGLKCLEAAAATTPCSGTDIECQLQSSCANTTLQLQIQYCVAEICTLKESLTTKNASVALCQQPVRNESLPLILLAMIGFGIAVVAFLLRLVSRGVGEGTFLQNAGWDDAMMAAALVLVGGISACSVILAKNGLGKDIWTVPFDSITTLLHVYYIDEIVYIITLPMIKISIVMTYLRVFPDRVFQIMGYAVICLNVCYAVAFTIVTARQCTPISYAWTRWDGEHQGICWNINAQVISAAAVNILLDVIIVAMPMPFLWRLNMKWKKKLMVMSMFAVGLFVTVVSMLRLRYVIKFADSQNLTWDYRTVGDWSIVEMVCSVLCACMPALRRLLKTMWPKLWGSTNGRSRDNGPSEPSKRSVTADGDMKGAHNKFIPLHDLDASSSQERLSA